MEPVYFPEANHAVTITLFMGVVLSMITCIISACLIGEVKLKDKYMYAISTISMLVFVGSSVTLAVGAIQQSFDEDAAKKERIELIETTYDLPVSEDDFDQLKYPSEQPKAGEVSSYGTVLITAIESTKVRQLQVTLLWTGTEFQLATNETGSTELKELPREK